MALIEIKTLLYPKWSRLLQTPEHRLFLEAPTISPEFREDSEQKINTIFYVRLR